MKVLLYSLLLFSIAKADVLSEEQKINMLLEHVKNEKDAVFLRNGSEHSAEDAYEHLARKLKYGWFHGFSNGTTIQFIDKIATESSTSGKKYKIKLKIDGEEKIILLRDYLLGKLEEIEKDTEKKATSS